MRRVAIVNADFAPSSLPPALRVRLFASHLPELGWQPIVVTTRPQEYETPIDPQNLALLPERLEVIRTPALPVRATRRFGVGDVAARSLWHHWRCLSRLAREGRVDALLLPVPPFMTMILGRLLHATHRIPYVVDYSDPWVSDEWRQQPASQRLPKRALVDRIGRTCEPLALRRVAHIVGVSHGLLDGVVSRYPWLSDVGTTEIPFGGESTDFDYVRRHPQLHGIFEPDDGVFHFTAASACTPPMLPVIGAVLAGLQLARTRRPEMFAKFRLHFVGTSYTGGTEARQVVPLAVECGVGDLVGEQPARISYLQSLQLLLDSDALLATGLVLARYTASKVFPYLLSERPLLAVLHEESNAAATLRDLGCGSLVTFDDHTPPATRVEELAQRLIEIVGGGKGRRMALDRRRFEPYTARAMAGRLARVLDGVADD